MTRKQTRQCLFLSMSGLDKYCCDDDLAVVELERSGVKVDTADWRQLSNWDKYDWVIVRSTWDYQHAPQAFFDLLAVIDASPSQLANPLDVMRSNQDKRYLLKVAEAGVPIVPTSVCESPTVADLAGWLYDYPQDGFVVKPVVSAGAERTHWLHSTSTDNDLALAASELADRTVLRQPFLTSIQSTGEYSVFFFNNDFSHSIQKRPKTNDFRVQEEHGGDIFGVTAATAMVDAANKALATLDAPTLYARVDLVPIGETYALMELELIEPSLYFRCSEDAPKRFAAACQAYFD